ncbi:UDP pyrophosphate synthase [Acidobacteria bacterium Mor1]|nr:UDP pyrophosphate synthase [Acidobacteria bacterium Mor1]
MPPAGSDTAGGLHVAIIMDGNGRWAQRRSLRRAAGHRAGVRAVRRVVESAPSMGIGALTLYAFSSDNWQRPKGEVQALMRLLREFIPSETRRSVRNGVRLRMIGRRDRLDPGLVRSIEKAEAATSGGRALDLRLAIDYSARDQILRAASALEAEGATRESFDRRLATAGGLGDGYRDVDFLIRTGGEQRLSDFLLWECAYAELYFTPVMWPDFTAADLETALAEFQRRQRRFGQVPESSAG